MSIDGVNGRTSYIGMSIINLRNQLNDLTQQLASGRVSTTYAGQGANRGFALSLRAQVSSFDAFKDTATNVNTRLSVVNLALHVMCGWLVYGLVRRTLEIASPRPEFLGSRPENIALAAALAQVLPRQGRALLLVQRHHVEPLRIQIHQRGR